MQANAALSPEARIAKAKELIGDITPAQQQAILEAHNQPGEIYNLNLSQIRARVEILKKAGFTSEQVRVLMENGICGKNLHEITINTLNGVRDALLSDNLDKVCAIAEKVSPTDNFMLS